MKKTKRPWGWYTVLSNDEETGYKIKELEIAPGESLSYQRHFERAEYWYVLDGTVKIETEWKKMKNTVHITKHSGGYHIGKRVWHQASNPTKQTVKILEVQYGNICEETDIERK